MEKGVINFDRQEISTNNLCLQECTTLIDEQRIARNKRRCDQRTQKKNTLQRKSRNVEKSHFQDIY